MRAEGTVVSAEELLEKAWDENADPFTNAVRVAVMTLRRKLGDPPVIETVAGAGYRICGTPRSSARLALTYLGAAIVAALAVIGIWDHHPQPVVRPAGSRPRLCKSLRRSCRTAAPSSCSYDVWPTPARPPADRGCRAACCCGHWLAGGPALQPAARHRRDRARVRPAEHGPAHRVARRRRRAEGTGRRARRRAGPAGGRATRASAGSPRTPRTSCAPRWPSSGCSPRWRWRTRTRATDLRRLGAQLLRVNERNERLIEGLLVLAESDRGLPGKVPVRLDELARSVLDSHAELADKHRVELRQRLRARCRPRRPRAPGAPAREPGGERDQVQRARRLGRGDGRGAARAHRQQHRPARPGRRRCPRSSSRSAGWARPIGPARRRRGPGLVDRALNHHRPPAGRSTPGLAPKAA